jgi:hypothetical protein
MKGKVNYLTLNTVTINSFTASVLFEFRFFCSFPAFGPGTVSFVSEHSDAKPNYFFA